MKREIKFRAWDKGHKRMLNIETLALRFSPKGVLTSIYTYGPDFSNDPEIIGDDEPDLDSVILEQFTGLDDINGKDIYEGDLVRLDDDSEEPIYKVIFDEAKFEIYGDGVCYDLGEEFMNCEVIGNIFENQELLEAEE